MNALSAVSNSSVACFTFFFAFFRSLFVSFVACAASSLSASAWSSMAWSRLSSARRRFSIACV